jgi:hypothetical protein
MRAKHKLVALLLIIVALFGRPSRQQNFGDLPASFFEPIGGGGAADAGAAGANPGTTIPLDAGAESQPIGAGVNENPTIPLESETGTEPIGAGVGGNTPAGGAAGVGTGAAAGAVGATVGVDEPVDPVIANAAGAADPFVTDPNAGVAESSPGSEIAVEKDTGEPEAPLAPETPPAPPKNWEFLPEDKQIIFGLEINGPSLVPWTKTKSWNFVQTLQNTVLQSTDVSKSIEVGVTDSYRKQVVDDNLPGSEVDHSMDSGIQMRLAVNTNSIRVESEVRSMIQAVQSGQLAKDLTIALGSEVSNITMITDPEVVPYNSVEDPNASTGGSLPGWIIGAIVGGIIILIPIPAYLLYRRSKRKHIEALAKQQAEAAAARQRMQSRIIKSTGKSFSQGPGDVDLIENGEYYLNTPTDSVTGRQQSGNWVTVDGSGRSFTPPPGYSGGSPLPARSLQQQHQRAMYQSNSLGPGGLPQVNRIGSFSGQSAGRGSSVYPVHRYSDSSSLPSSSSGGGEGR